MRYFICGVLYLLSFQAFAVECFNPDETQAAILAIKLLPYRNVWPGYDNLRFPLFLSTKNPNHTVVIGAHEEELKNAKVIFEACNLDGEHPAFLLTETIAAPENHLYSFRLLSHPGTDAIGQYVSKNSLPAIQVKLKNDINLTDAFVARTVVHEGFHALFQFTPGQFKTDFKNAPGRDFFKTCLAVPVWSRGLKDANALLAESILETNHEKLKSLWLKVREIRKSIAADKNSVACLQAQEFWERIEGTAHFVETESAIAAGLISPNDMANEFTKYMKAPDMTDAFFYYTGDALIKLAKTIGIKSWSEKIDSGVLPGDLE